MSKPSLPVRLALLVAGTMLPLIIFMVGIIFHSYLQDRKDATAHVLQTVRSIRLTLDAEMERITGGLQVLAMTDTLKNGDFDGFRGIALGFIDQYSKGGVLLVSDREGRMLFSTLSEGTANLPLRNNRAIVKRLFERKQPQYSNLFFGAAKRAQIVTVEVPVSRGGEVIYDISFTPPFEMFQHILESQRPNSNWTLSLLDGNGVVFGRLPNPRENFGKRVAPSVLDDMLQRSEAVQPTTSLDGVHLMSGFVHSPLTGWIVAAGVSESSLAAPFWRDLAIASVIGVVLLAIGLAFALRMATTIARGETLHDLLIQELNHRVKNTLAILQAIAAQTFRGATRAERETFEGRLGALAEAHNLLSREKWRGSELSDVISCVLQPYVLTNPARVRMFGPKVPLSPRLAVVLSMIVHEIATNAAKYGALSNDNGTVTVDWEILEEAPRKLRLIWTEAGGPPVVAPVQRGFGSRLIERSARDQLGGEATVDFLPHGVVYTVIGSLEEKS